jgi:hypothetical protein
LVDLWAVLRVPRMADRRDVWTVEQLGKLKAALRVEALAVL